ncbi:baseplate J/gp47 family protein [Zooshikella sp. RANM57]|uniref:baseplate J/gp47 family protein n=1 Tax=Zooshikella sp. RANM57 TaxID=3425863 RepID=UPI003D6EB8B2
MAAFKLLDLSKIPVPDVINSPDFEQKYSELKDILLGINDKYADVLALESEPLAVALQAFAYRELILEAKINDATRANMLASAQGNDLDAIGARYNVGRLVLQDENLLSNPPVPHIAEEDDRYRRRIQMAFDGLNTAGSTDAYIFHALSASAEVLDADATSPSPCEMVVTILSREGNGGAGAELVRVVRNYFGLTDDGSKTLGSSKVRPLGDKLTVSSAHILEYSVVAELSILPGPSARVVLADAKNALSQYTKDTHRLGYDVTLSGLYAALHRPGVHNVKLISPTANLTVDYHQAAYCVGINIKIGGVDE